MKAKKVNKIEAVRNLLSANPKIKTEEVMEKLKTSKTYTYVLMSKARRLNKEQSAPNGKLLYRLTGTQAVLAQKMGVPIEDYAKLHGEVVGVAPDPVNHPAHYTAGGIETIDFIEAKRLGYNLGNVVKYITRSGLKGNQLEDLRKAQWYLSREIATLK
jgi:succinate dehydrogenase/fumarate reductase flavoprotein subunit